jgi:hypothetical protein
LGAVKQLPVVIRALHEVMPNLSYVVPEHTTVAIVKRDLGKKSLVDVSTTNSGIPTDITTADITMIADIILDINSSPIDGRFALIDGRFALYRNSDYVSADIWIDPLKFEPRPLLSGAKQKALKQRYMLDAETIIVGGCLRSNEIDLLLRAVARHPTSVQAVVAPCWARDYSSDMRTSVKKYGLTFVDDAAKPTQAPDIVFLKTHGLLDTFYSIGDIAVIGDSFYHGSGQNPLEPAFYGKRIIAGKYAKNNLRAFEILEQSKLLTRVHENDFPRELRRHVAKHEIASYAAEAKRLIATEQGVAKRFAAALQDYLYSQ